MKLVITQSAALSTAIGLINIPSSLSRIIFSLLTILSRSLGNNLYYSYNCKYKKRS